MNHSNKFFFIALIVSVFLHIALIFGLQLPNIKTQNVEFTPVEVVLEAPQTPPEPEVPNHSPAEPEKPKEKETNEKGNKKIAADKAEKDHESAVKPQTKVKSKILTHKKNSSSQEKMGSSIDFGSSMSGPIGRDNKKPEKMTQAQRELLAQRDNNGNTEKGESTPSNTTLGDDKKHSNNNQQTEDKTKKPTVVATGPITPKEISAAGGRIQPREGIIVPFPKRSAEIRYGGLLPGKMTLTRNGSNYTITAIVNVPFKKMVFVSKGTIVDNKFKPSSYSDTRGGKLYSSAEFDYENKIIHYGKEKGSTKEIPMEENPLDTFSAAWQLAMNQGRVSGPLQVSTGKGIKTYQVGELLTQTGDYEQGEGKLRVRKITIPASKKTSYGLATDFGYFPATITYDGYELYVDKFVLDGVDYWKAVNKVAK